MNFASMILPQRFVEALGWTLFHALWQGALAALGFAAALYVTRRTSARLRYMLGLAALALTLLLSLLTFGNHYAAGGPAAPARNSAGAFVPALTASTPLPAAAGPSRSQHLVAFFSDYFSRHLPLAVTLWLLGVLFLTLRFTGGMLYVQRLKYRQNRPLPQAWTDRLRELAARAGLRRPLQLLESLRLKTPVVIGHLKPVLLLPAGLVTGLPVDEVEALLAHELAHVMRRDYLVNVAQNLVEILYFFHPGVRWISACVRQEREHCCDDFAVALCGDAQNYARALARLQVADAGFAEPALAAAGPRRGLLRRIARLLGGPRLVHDFREGFVSALLLVLGLLGMLKLAASPGVTAPGTTPATATVAAPAAGSSPAFEPAPAAKAQATGRFALVSFVLKAGGTVKLEARAQDGAGAATGTWLVDDADGGVIWFMDLSARAKTGGGGSFSEEVPLGRGSYSWYRPDGWKATAQWRTAAGKGPWQPLTMFIGGNERLLTGRRAEDELLRQDREEERLQQENLLQKELQKQEELLHLSAQERELKVQELRKLEQERRAMSEADRQLREADRRAREEALSALELEKREGREKDGLSREVERLRVEEERLRSEEKRLRIEELNFKKFLTELADSGLVDEAGGYEIKLSAGALVINGKTQPDAVHQRVKKSYEALTGKKLEGKRVVTIINEKD